MSLPASAAAPAVARLAVKLKRKKPANEHDGPVLGQQTHSTMRILHDSTVAHSHTHRRTHAPLCARRLSLCCSVRFPHGPPPHLTKPELADDIEFKMYANPEERKVTRTDTHNSSAIEHDGAQALRISHPPALYCAAPLLRSFLPAVPASSHRISSAS